jgi:hypothetical protein
MIGFAAPAYMQRMDGIVLSSFVEAFRELWR